MIYYTADLHLGFARILKACTRPFASVEEMDEVLIRNWNETVGNQDTVYILYFLVGIRQKGLGWDRTYRRILLKNVCMKTFFE